MEPSVGCHPSGHNVDDHVQVQVITMPRERSDKGSVNCFDFMRLFAAATVVVGHATTHLQISFLWLEPEGRYWFRDGVPLFFILSGFLIFKSCDKCIDAHRPIRHFYLNRLLRIAPAIYAYAVTTVIILLVTRVMSVTDLFTLPFAAWTASTMMLVTVFHPSIFEQFGVGVLNGSLWTIPVESSFYAFVPLVVFTKNRFGAPFTMLALVILSMSSLLFRWEMGVTFGNESILVKLLDVTFLPYLIFFTLGIIWTRYWERVPKHRSVFVGSLAIYGTVRLGPLQSVGLTEQLLVGVWALALSYAALWFGYCGPQALSGITGWLGDLSFGTYIWHMVLINFVLEFGLVQTRGRAIDSLTIACVLAATMLVAYVSWHLVEKRALTFKPYTSHATSALENPKSKWRGNVRFVLTPHRSNSARRHR